MKKNRYLTALVLAAAAIGSASAQPAATVPSTPAAATASQGINKPDSARIVAIAQANLAEIATGKLALEKSSSAEVKQFAQMMIDDHTKGLDATRALAESKKVVLPAKPDAAHEKMAARLATMSGSKFDKEYVSKAGVADHAKVHAALKKDIKQAQDADVRALAAKLEPTVAHHLDMARKLNATLK